MFFSVENSVNQESEREDGDDLEVIRSDLSLGVTRDVCM